MMVKGAGRPALVLDMVAHLSESLVQLARLDTRLLYYVPDAVVEGLASCLALVASAETQAGRPLTHTRSNALALPLSLYHTHFRAITF
jgi:hypothetical protein